MPSAVTRRTLLARAGIAVAALAATGTGALELLRAAAPSTPVAGLTTARRRTYVALVDAVGRGTRSQIDPSRAAAAANSLASDYSSRLEPTRRAIDDVLDRLERARAGRPFSAQDPVSRLALLRSLAATDQSDLAARAVSLAAAPFHPPAADYHPTPVTL